VVVAAVTAVVAEEEFVEELLEPPAAIGDPPSPDSKDSEAPPEPPAPPLPTDGSPVPCAHPAIATRTMAPRSLMAEGCGGRASAAT